MGRRGVACVGGAGAGRGRGVAGVGGGRRGWPSTEGVGWVGVASRVRRVVVSTAEAWSACVACVAQTCELRSETHGWLTVVVCEC